MSVINSSASEKLNVHVCMLCMDIMQISNISTFGDNLHHMAYGCSLYYRQFFGKSKITLKNVKIPFGGKYTLSPISSSEIECRLHAIFFHMNFL